jgi:hypothetical protein
MWKIKFALATLVAFFAVVAQAADPLFVGNAEGYETATPTTTEYTTCSIVAFAGTDAVNALNALAIEYSGKVRCYGHDHQAYAGSVSMQLCLWDTGVPPTTCRVVSTALVSTPSDGLAFSRDLFRWYGIGADLLGLFSVTGSFTVYAPGETFVAVGALAHGFNLGGATVAGQASCTTASYGYFTCQFRSGAFTFAELTPVAP